MDRKLLYEYLYSDLNAFVRYRIQLNFATILGLYDVYCGTIRIPPSVHRYGARTYE